MRSGKRCYIFDPRPEDYDIRDIAFGLSRRFRWNGQSDITVAQHSVLCYQYHSTREMLLHDASEAPLADIPSQLKHHPEFSLYRELEQKHMNAIASAFWFLGPDGVYRKSLEVDLVDKASRLVEGLILFSHRHRKDWRWSGISDSPHRDRIESISRDLHRLYYLAGVWSPAEAESQFLQCYQKSENSRRLP